MEDTRGRWLQVLQRISVPVLHTLAERRLKLSIPLTFHEDRAAYAPLEAFGRVLCGIAPWLEATGLTPQEEKIRIDFAEMVLECIDAATDPKSPDRMPFSGMPERQPLVDAAFLAQGLVRAPSLAARLDGRVRKNLIDCLKETRATTPYNTNWLFFSAFVEAGLYQLGEKDWMPGKITHATKTFMQWYKGDGVYGDGPEFCGDYYNSFVIQPMLVDLVCLLRDEPEIAQYREVVMRRASRYAAILERMIAPDGTYPIVGRSVTYRFGVFHLLAQAVLGGFLPDDVHPAQVRCALTATIDRVMGAPDMFDAQGWLQPGVWGRQPSLAEPYINIGSLYLCTTVLLPLGLTPQARFWSAPDLPWTAQKVWSGMDVPADHALNE